MNRRSYPRDALEIGIERLSAAAAGPPRPASSRAALHIVVPEKARGLVQDVQRRRIVLQPHNGVGQYVYTKGLARGDERVCHAPTASRSARPPHSTLRGRTPREEFRIEPQRLPELRGRAFQVTLRVQRQP